MNIPTCSNAKITYFIVCPVITLILVIRYRGIFTLPKNVQDIIYYSESSFYYSFYGHSFTFRDLIDSRSEWPNIYISFRRYNILFEYIILLIYKIISFVYSVDKFNVYAFAVLFIHSMGISSLFLISSIIGDCASGLCCIVLYMSLFQEKLISRISALPLRENISLPFFWMSIPPLLKLMSNRDFTSTNTANYANNKCFRVLYGTCIALSLLTWQFSPFLVSTQLLVIIFLNYLQVISTSVSDGIINSSVVAFIAAGVLSLFSPLMIGSLLVKVFITYYITNIIYYRINTLECKVNVSNSYRFLKQFTVKSVVFSVILIVMNMFFNIFFTDYSHVFDIFFVKLGLKKPTFDTLIYEMGVEFRFFPRFMYQLILNTNMLLLLVISLILLLLSSRKPQHYYLLLQTFGFALLMLLVARLRVLALPMLCVIASLSASLLNWSDNPIQKYIPPIYKIVIKWIVPVVVLSIAAKPLLKVGIFNEIGRYRYGENYYNDQADELVQWVNAAMFTDHGSDSKCIVFSDMPTSSILRSATMASLVINPHYENKPIKQRIRLYYALASCISDPKWLYDRLNGYGVKYLVVQMKMLHVKGDGIESLINSLEYERSSCRPREALENRLMYKILTDADFFRLVFVNGNYLVFALDRTDGLNKLELNLPNGDTLSLYLPVDNSEMMKKFHDIALEEFSDVLGDIGYVEASKEIDKFLLDYFNHN